MTEARPAVLIVDDIDANLVAMAALLRELECDVVKASSGNDALRHLLKRDFAVLLLDVQMPEMDGFEVARLARSHPRSSEVPILFITAMLETDDSLFRGYESGAVDVLFKPINAHVLVSKVKVFLELHRSRQRLADEIEAHKRTLAELDAFNYSVSHDLRAPLRPLAGFSQILLEDYADKLDANGQHLLLRIAAAAHRMEAIIEDLRRLSEITRTRPTPQAIDLTLLVETIVTELRSQDPARRVDVAIAPGMKALGDARLLRLAVENLLRNAWKFTSKQPRASIEVGAAARGETTVYHVKDDGVGFDPAHADKLFGAFQRLHGADEFEGTGVGLAIVQRVIERHGGRVWGEGSPGAGATFYFTLG